MTTYKVIEFFLDLQDDSYAYSPGDKFPREGVIVSKERYEELASDKNKLGKPLIVAEMPQKAVKKDSDAEQPTEPKKTAKKANTKKK